MKVYIAGPITKGDVAANVRNAILAADAVRALGHIPFVPHLNHFWHMVAPRSYEDWLKIDMAWLRECDCVLRLPGESNGADLEVAEAVRLSIPVYYSIRELRSAGI